MAYKVVNNRPLLVDMDTDKVVGFADTQGPGQLDQHLVFGEPNHLTGVIEIIDPATGLPIAVGGGSSSAPVAITASRATAAGDNGAILENSTASVLTVTLTASTIASGLTLMNTGTGQTVVTAGAGVTFVDGSTSVSAPFQGQMIHTIPTVTANRFLAKVG